uniref:(northern house mosquito) hypothetical protein n=1 Tax=Culex pipiens TaxID=7175 RepID=A0A8D8AVH1_CULPI
MESSTTSGAPSQSGTDRKPPVPDRGLASDLQRLANRTRRSRIHSGRTANHCSCAGCTGADIRRQCRRRPLNRLGRRRDLDRWPASSVDRDFAGTLLLPHQSLVALVRPFFDYF